MWDVGSFEHLEQAGEQPVEGGEARLAAEMRSNRADKVALRAGDGMAAPSPEITVVPPGYRWRARPCPVGRASHGGTCDCLEMPQGISRLPFLMTGLSRWAARRPRSCSGRRRCSRNRRRRRRMESLRWRRRMDSRRYGRACPRGSTGTSHARRSAARERRCAARAGPSYGLRGQTLLKARYDNRGATSWRKGSSSDQFRMSFDNPSSPPHRAGIRTARSCSWTGSSGPATRETNRGCERHYDTEPYFISGRAACRTA